MLSSFKIMILYKDLANGTKLASVLNKAGFYACSRTMDDKNIFSSIIHDMPDFILYDIDIPDVDMTSFIKDVKNSIINAPEFIVISNVKNSFIKNQILKCGAIYLEAPFSTSELTALIKTASKQRSAIKYSDAEMLVTSMIQKLGIPPHMQGFTQLRSAVLESLFDHRMLENLTKRLYPAVAEKYGTLPCCVERNIRQAIEYAWNNGYSKEIMDFFGYSRKRRTKPTNMELLALVTEKIRMKLKG